MRDVLLALFLLTAFPLVLYRYQIGALVIVFISCMYPQSNTFGFALTIPWLDFFFVFAIAGYLLKQGYKDYRHHTLITFLILLYFWVSLSTIFAINPYFAYDPWMKFTKILILALVTYAMLTNEIRLMAYVKVMVLSFGFYGLKGGIFTINNGGTSHVLGPINSFFADNNGMALVLVMTLPFMVFLISHAQNLYQKYFALFCTLCTGVAILGTQSRTGTVALAAAGLYFIWLQKKLFKSILIVAPIVCVAYFYMPASWTERMSTTTELESDDSFQGRVEMWEASVRVANDNPILGGGFNVIYLKEVIVKYIPLGVMPRAIHSAYFQMIAEHGYVGLVIFLIMLYMTFHYARRMAKRSQEMSNPLLYNDLSIAIRCSLAGYMVMGLTANIAFFDLIYFIIIATAIADGIMERAIAPKRQFDLHAKPALAI